MKTVVFYSPHFGESTLRFVTQIRGLTDVEVIGLGQDSLDYIRNVNHRYHCFDDFSHVTDATNQSHLEAALAQIQETRRIHHLLNIQEPLQLLIARLREKFGISGMGLETARIFRDKALMKQTFMRHNIRCADFKKVESLEAERDFVQKHNYPIIIKPLKGAGSENTFILYNDDDFKRSLEHLRPSRENPVQLEEFIEGQEGSFDTATIDNEIRFYGITTYHPSPLAAMLNPWIQPIYMFNRNQDGPEFADVRAVGREVIRAMQPGTNMTHMEWFQRERDGQIYAAEIAARPPGEPILALHNYGHDMNLFFEWNNVLINNRFDTRPFRKHNVGAACIRAQGNGPVVRHIEGIDTIRREVGHLLLEEALPSLGTQKTNAYIGEGTIFCRGEDYKEVFEAMTFIVNTIRIYC